jgi:type IV pilus assembly protein PilC
MVAQLLGVGEETGQLRDVLRRVSDFYTREVDERVRNLVTVIEPLIMVIMGLAVGVMVAAVIMPMYNLANQV